MGDKIKYFWSLVLPERYSKELVALFGIKGILIFYI
jgi:hypothetical protein